MSPDVKKSEPLISITPNGRMPAFHDPNTGAKLWESGAIIEYLLDVYDEENRLSYTTFPEKYEQGCWKHFQMSGQGPYYGQRSWFLHVWLSSSLDTQNIILSLICISFRQLHEEQLPSAQIRYEIEIKRILSVINDHLARTKRSYLVGEKLCFADLMFVPWDNIRKMALMSPSFEDAVKVDYPHFHAWQKRLFAVDSVKKAHAFIMDSAAANPGKEADIAETIPK